MRSWGGMAGGTSCKAAVGAVVRGPDSCDASPAASSSELESEATARAGADLRRGVALLEDCLDFAVGRGGLKTGALRFAGAVDPFGGIGAVL